MQRRSFLTTAALGGAAPLAAAEGTRTGFYVLERYYMRQGTQPGRLHDWLRESLVPAMRRFHAGPMIVLEAMIADHVPQIAVISGHASHAEWLKARARAIADKEFLKTIDAWETGAEAPYEHFSQTLLESTDYSPEIAVPREPPKSSRIFELRIYHSPTRRQLRALHERFAGPEIRIFHRVGIHPILYTSTVSGTNMPNLTYLIPFASLSDREKAWDAFTADPEWIKVRKESIDRHGQISSVIHVALYKAAPYSPVR